MPALVKSLMDTSYDDFRKIAEEDIRSADKGDMDPMVFEALRTSPVIQRYYSVLGQMQKSVEGQLAAGKADMRSRTAKMKSRGTTNSEYQEALAKHENWRAGALRFKTGAEQRMAEIAGLLREIDTEFFADRVKEERNDALARIRELEDVIRRHRDHVCTDETCDRDRTCIADDELWTLIT